MQERVLLCDYGGVLSLLQPAELISSMADLCGLSSELFVERYWLDRGAYDRGDLSPLDYWTDVIGHAPSAATLERLDRLDVKSWLQPNRESLETVSCATQSGMRPAILSNAPASLARRLETVHWLDFIHDKFFSCDLRLTKPAPEIFQVVMGRLGMPPRAILFVDDRLDNIQAASALGMRTIHFRGTADFSLEEALRGLPASGPSS
ncbi:MAG TPA: HAD family phosphatase [Chloroflexota bacterium]|nr:HAD family phosphatase [Chloroflexota bacterium]